MNMVVLNIYACTLKMLLEQLGSKLNWQLTNYSGYFFILICMYSVFSLTSTTELFLLAFKPIPHQFHQMIDTEDFSLYV